MGLSTTEKNISELREDTAAIYDDSSSSEDEGDTLSQESLSLDPVEEGEILVEAYLQIFITMYHFMILTFISCKHSKKDQRYF